MSPPLAFGHDTAQPLLGLCFNGPAWSMAVMLWDKPRVSRQLIPRPANLLAQEQRASGVKNHVSSTSPAAKKSARLYDKISLLRAKSQSGADEPASTSTALGRMDPPSPRQATIIMPKPNPVASLAGPASCNLQPAPPHHNPLKAKLPKDCRSRARIHLA